MRPIPAPPAPEISSKRKAGHEISVEVCLITRLYGGGVRPGQIDERSWIRPPAFKSGLRFWWRAAFAHTYSSLAALHRQESRLFGCPGRFVGNQVEGGPGLVSVRVIKATASTEIEGEVFSPAPGSALSVAYFPAALPHEGEEEHKLAKADTPARKVRVRLVVNLDPGIGDGDREQVEAALRLFLLLGGVGSRTRRGAGAIGVVREDEARACGLPLTPEELRPFLERVLRPAGGTGAGPAGMWSLAGARAAWSGRPTADAEEAQLTLLEVLRDVRQDRPHPRSWQGKADWGQSRWPEADAIRWKTREFNRPDPTWKHQPKTENAARYPRAALGLPIIIHFKREDTGRGRDPFDHTISGFLPEGKGKRISRFASPLVLRPVRLFSNGKACYVPVAILGPMSLPPQLIPVVELTKNGAPPDLPEVSNRVPTYPIAAHAEETENKIIDRFRSFNRIV